jgi:hypothetical protein
MKRPVGVTASGVVAILGSIFTVLLAVGAIASLFLQTTQPQPPNARSGIIAGAAMFAVLAGLGIWTSVGLFRLRPWARVSILIFAGFLAAGCIFAFAATMVVPMPATMPAGAESNFRRMIAVMFGVPFAIAVWWLIQFNTPSTKAAFASSTDGVASPRPLSITIIGWLCIIGVASCLFPIFIRTPVFLFGAVLEGWIAVVIYVFFSALSLYIGKGLLDLQERARIMAIWWFGLSFVHLSLVMLVPSWRQRMLEMSRTFEPNQQAPIPFEGMLANLTLAFLGLWVAIVIWLLVKNRAAFVRAEST